VDEVRNQADLRMYLTHVARRHVTLELAMEDFETQLEREFKLAPFTLRGELRGLDQLLSRSKDVHAAAIAKFELADDDDYRDLCNIADDFITSSTSSSPLPLQQQYDHHLRQCSGDLEQLYADAAEAHHKLRSLFASEWQMWKTVGVPVEARLHRGWAGSSTQVFFLIVLCTCLCAFVCAFCVSDLCVS